MFDPNTKLFCHRRVRTAEGLVREGASPRYTMITLLGLLECAAAGMAVPFDVENILDALLADLTWIEGVGDLGLLLWLSASASSRHLGKLCASIDIKDALHRFADAREGSTTEVAWFLAGLSHAIMADAHCRDKFAGVAFQTYELLMRNQGKGGIFGHLAKGRTLKAALRSHIGCFADQVYPIYALTRFGEAFDKQASFAAAYNCAESICRLQGKLGQWWWHYDSNTGEVLGKYPVFSVHQDGMAPMALFALSDATGWDFRGPVYRGLQWITGANELEYDMQHWSDDMIWRSIHRGSKYKTYLAGALRSFGYGGKVKLLEQLRVRFECRPYHFGWLLFAFATRQASKPRSANGNEPGVTQIYQTKWSPL